MILTDYLDLCLSAGREVGKGGGGGGEMEWDVILLYMCDSRTSLLCVRTSLLLVGLHTNKVLKSEENVVFCPYSVR